MSKQHAAECLLALLLFCGSCSSSTPESVVRFKLIRESVITVPVLVNGRGPFDFVFDTGTESSLIDSKLAEELNISPVDRVLVSNLGGEIALARGFASELSLGPMKVLHSEIVIGDLAGLHSVNSHIQGIIGQNVLSHFDYVIDYAHSMIEFPLDTNSEEAIAGTKTKLERRHGCPVITSRMNSGVNLQLSLDSGSSNLVLYKSSLPSSARVVTAHLQTSGRAIEARNALVQHLEVGDVSLWGLQTVLIDNSQTAQIDGLLPTRLFSAVYFNNREGYVVFRKK